MREHSASEMLAATSAGMPLVLKSSCRRAFLGISVIGVWKRPASHACETKEAEGGASKGEECECEEGNGRQCGSPLLV